VKEASRVVEGEQGPVADVNRDLAAIFTFLGSSQMDTAPKLDARYSCL
jgi:hypothetical protein